MIKDDVDEIDEKDLGNANGRRGSIQIGVDEIERERKARKWVREKGRQEHGDEDGVKEGTKMVDLGNGPEEVVIVDWRPDDPEVSSCLVV